MKVCKFGGSSVASAEQILKVFEIVRSDPERRIVVVSAPGKRFKGDDKVTDLLIALAEAGLRGQDPEPVLAKLLGRFESIRADLDLPKSLVEETEADLRARLALDRSHEGRYMDAIKAAGEDLSARYVAAAFTRRGLPAVYVNPKDAGMLLSDEFGNARLLRESYKAIGRALAPIRDIVVFPGFFGYTKGGDIATFPRGGSDITGAILAAAVGAEVYENFTDVDNVYPVDPRIVSGLSVGIKEMTYREMRELSYAGFGVFHDEAVQPAIEARIPINIRNTNHPEEPGTRVVERRKTHPGRVLGIASADGFCTVHLSKYLLNREVGFGRRVLQIFEEEGVSFEHMPSGIDNLSVVLRESFFPEPVRERVIERIRTELGCDEVYYEGGLAIIMVVGEGMRYALGVASRILSCLAAAGVNIEMLNQGSSEISIMIGIRGVDRIRAVQALFDEFFHKDGSSAV